jgi:N-acetylglucosaminyldiphosphoundecaprenol N-acetyl-beta-D-mannosaminyltransferase
MNAGGPTSVDTESAEPKSAVILGVRVHAVSLEGLLARICDTIRAGKRAIITYVNVHAVNLAVDLEWFRDFINHSDITFCDGLGVKWGAWLLGQDIPHRMTPPDWIDSLAALACAHRFTMFFLGARPGVAAAAATRLKERFPEISIVGTSHGYFDKTPASLENENVVQAINRAKPNILILGFGMPMQERWLMENWGRLEVNIALTGGAVFDYVSGELRRGPRWMTDHGFEWLGRLIIEPRRLWKRYLIGNPRFLWRIVKLRMGASPF